MFETLPSWRTRATLLDGGLSKTGVRRYESDDKYRDAEDQFRGDAVSHDSGTHDDSDSKCPLSHDDGGGLVFPGIQIPFGDSDLISFFLLG